MSFYDPEYSDVEEVPGTDDYESGNIWRRTAEWYDDMEETYGEDDDEFQQEANY